MEGRTLAIGAFNTKLDDNFQIVAADPSRAREDRGAACRRSRTASTRDMDPYKAARQMDTDEIVPLGELRDYLEALVEALPGDRLPPREEPADLVAARSRRAGGRPLTRTPGGPAPRAPRGIRANNGVQRRATGTPSATL